MGTEQSTPTPPPPPPPPPVDPLTQKCQNIVFDSTDCSKLCYRHLGRPTDGKVFDGTQCTVAYPQLIPNSNDNSCIPSTGRYMGVKDTTLFGLDRC